MDRAAVRGRVHVNGQTISDAAHIPTGGMGESGNGGRYGGHWNLDEFTYWQWVTAHPLPAMWCAEFQGH